jgi:hypothetical protein
MSTTHNRQPTTEQQPTPYHHTPPPYVFPFARLPPSARLSPVHMVHDTPHMYQPSVAHRACPRANRIRSTALTCVGTAGGSSRLLISRPTATPIRNTANGFMPLHRISRHLRRWGRGGAGYKLPLDIIVITWSDNHSFKSPSIASCI